MKADNIVVKEIPFVNIMECKINKEMNNHGTATIKGIIEDTAEQQCLELATEEKYVSIYGKELGGSEECIFIGYIDSIEISCGDVKVAKLKLITGTNKIDLKMRTRSFQNTGMTYKEMLRSNEALNKDTQCQSIFLENADKAIGNLIMQYKETDWEFAMRMASNLNTFIRPAFTTTGSKYFVGLNKGQAAKNKPKSFMDYKIYRLNEKYEEYKKGGGLSISPKDAYCYQFTSREIMELGDAVSLKDGEKLYIYSVHSKNEGQELLNTYVLRTEDGFKVPMQYNHKLIGASLNGSILKAERDKVEMSLDVDEGYADHGVKKFPYSTVYSSPDGTGWYCMPEIGDCIRLYFPTEREKDAYAISSVHLEVSDGGDSNGNPAPRTDPNYKSFKNPKGKEILFAPNRLSIINPDVGSIILDDAEGIVIDSKKSIRFKAINYVEMHSTTSTINLTSGTDLTLEQGEDVKFALKDDIYMQGGKLKLQE